MTRSKGVVLALATSRKRGEAAELLDGVQARAPSGEYLVRIRLMTDIPHDAVVRRIEDIVQGDRELHGAEPRCEVFAARADIANEKLAQLLGNLHELGSIKQAQSRRIFNRIEQRKSAIVAGHRVV